MSNIGTGQVYQLHHLIGLYSGILILNPVYDMDKSVMQAL